MENALLVEHVQRYFPTGNGEKYYALKDINIEIPKGKLTILKGRSGSGKTTLLNILSALDDPSDGHVTFMDIRLGNLSAKEREDMRRYHMGFVFQSVALIPIMSAYENVDFALRLVGYSGNKNDRIREVIDKVGLIKRMNHMAGQLSGGEQQRIAIARAVAHRPEVIFADEPTAALDTASGYAVMELFKNLIKDEKTTIVMTTHNPELMEMGDVVYEISDGKIL